MYYVSVYCILHMYTYKYVYANSIHISICICKQYMYTLYVCVCAYAYCDMFIIVRISYRHMLMICFKQVTYFLTARGTHLLTWPWSQLYQSFVVPKLWEGTLFCATSLECSRHFIQHLWKYVWETFVHATLKFNNERCHEQDPQCCLCLKMFLLPCLQSSLLVNRLAKGGHPTWYRLWKRSLCLRQAKKLWDWIWLNCLLETPSSPVSDVHCKKKTSLTKPCSFGFCLEFPRILLSKNSGRLDWTTPRATSTFGMKHFTQMTI